MCYVLVSWDIDSHYKIHGIFTNKNAGKELFFQRRNLAKKHDKVIIYLMPLNHYIEKGMMI